MNAKRGELTAKNTNKSTKIKSDLIKDLRQIIEKTRQSVALAINSSLTALYWKIGHRIRSEILQDCDSVATISNRVQTRFCREKPSKRTHRFFPSTRLNGIEYLLRF